MVYLLFMLINSHNEAVYRDGEERETGPGTCPCCGTDRKVCEECGFWLECDECTDPADCECHDEETANIPEERAADLLPSGISWDRSREVWFDDDERTAVIPVERPLRRVEGWQLIVIALCVLGSMLGCATARPVVTVESPRELAPSADHVYQAPVHETTDLSTRYQAIDSDADAAPVVAADGGEVEAPEVQDKGGGIKMGGAR